MKRFIVESKNDELTANHIIDTLENEFDIIATVKEINPIDEANLDELAGSFNYHNQDDRYDDSEIGAYYGFQEGFKVGYRKAKEE